MLTRRGGWGRFLRYAASSVAATACSAVTFAVAYRVLHHGPRLASMAAFVSGFVVNFLGNRYWTWGRRQRAMLGRDMLGYAALAVGTALAATEVTKLADSYTDRLTVTDNQRVVLVELAYFATYGAMFLVKYVLLDRVLFGSAGRPPVPEAPVAPEPSPLPPAPPVGREAHDRRRR